VCRLSQVAVHPLLPEPPDSDPRLITTRISLLYDALCIHPAVRLDCCYRMLVGPRLLPQRHLLRTGLCLQPRLGRQRLFSIKYRSCQRDAGPKMACHFPLPGAALCCLDNGVYHLFYSRILGNGCTLNQWQTNSACWHAVGTNPLGPSQTWQKCCSPSATMLCLLLPRMERISCTTSDVGVLHPLIAAVMHLHLIRVTMAWRRYQPVSAVVDYTLDYCMPLI
jgi:hypothetical protein